jgi:site-specific recombinase XerC
MITLLRQGRRSRSRGHPVSEYAPAVQVALAGFISDIELEGRHATAASYRRMLAPLARLELENVALLTPAICRQLLMERVRTTTGSTASTFFAVLRSFCRYCIAQHYLATNPTDGLPKPPQRRPPHRWLTPPQLRAMYAACKDDAERLIMLLCGGSGLRAQELLTLKWSGVDFARGEVRVFGKGRKWRTLRPGALAMMLLSISAYNIDGRRLFVMPFRSTENLGYHVAQMAKRAGIAHCHPHMLRHSFAVNYLQSDGSAFGLQQLLGHSNPAMTGYYVRDAAEELARDEQARVGLSDRLFGDQNGGSART